MKRQRRKFTLLELLIVITIVAVLAGMLLPFLARARHKAKMATCVGNLKQIGSGLLMYDDSWDGLPARPGTLATARPDQLRGGGWDIADALLETVEDKRIFYCPLPADGCNPNEHWPDAGTTVRIGFQIPFWLAESRWLRPYPGHGYRELASLLILGADVLSADNTDGDNPTLANHSTPGKAPRGQNLLFADGHVAEGLSRGGNYLWADTPGPERYWFWYKPEDR